jgi:myo-inositol-1(or 4)-monophosphatase
MPASPLMNMMIGAARKAGRSLSRDFGEIENLQVSIKGPGNFVTSADHRSEKILYEELAKARHGYCFLMEESGYIEGPDKSHTWIVDPLDGTKNFMHGNPHFAISIALQRDNELVAGLVYNPTNGDMYAAERGKGAFFNDRRMRVSARTRFNECVVAIGKPRHGIRQLDDLERSCGGLRRTGAGAIDISWVAAGRYDAFWEEDIKPWDMAAGIVILREAGGFVCDINGGKAMFETKSIIAANNEAVMRTLQKMVAPST